MTLVESGGALHDQGRTCARLLITATRGEMATDDLVNLAPWQLITREAPGRRRRTSTAARYVIATPD